MDSTARQRPLVTFVRASMPAARRPTNGIGAQVLVWKNILQFIHLQFVRTYFILQRKNS
jgi:hypothetical protein